MNLYLGGRWFFFFMRDDSDWDGRQNCKLQNYFSWKCIYSPYNSRLIWSTCTAYAQNIMTWCIVLVVWGSSSWSSDWAVLSSRPAGGGHLSHLSTSLHYYPRSVLLWQKYCYHGRNSACHPSIYVQFSSYCILQTESYIKHVWYFLVTTKYYLETYEQFVVASVMWLRNIISLSMGNI